MLDLDGRGRRFESRSFYRQAELSQRAFDAARCELLPCCGGVMRLIPHARNHAESKTSLTREYIPRLHRDYWRDFGRVGLMARGYFRECFA